MPFITLDMKPGVYRSGTQYQARGRWYDANLVRFFEGTIRPWLGWNAHSVSTVTGKARAMLPWTDPTALLWIAVGTESHMYVYSRSGGQSNITPAGFTSGRADAILTAGYGGGTYGTSTYGNARGGSTTLQDASVWTLDQMEGLLVGVMADDGKLYSWDNNTADVMTQPAGSPTNNRAVFVTNEGFVFCLGAGGDQRTVKWPDQTSLTSWTPGSIVQAGSYVIQTPGRLMCGVRLPTANLIFASTDVHLATYQGLPAIYSFEQVGTGCGIISQAAFAKSTDFVAWMSLTGFWLYNGQVSSIPCEIQDDIFRNLNTLQRSKIWALHNSAQREIIWFYPRGTEIDSYAIWNYQENHWTNGSLVRTCGYEAGVFQWPLMIDASGNVYQHENGLSYAGGTTPYIESGPLQLGSPSYPGAQPVVGGQGDIIFDILGIEPDALTLGDVTATFYSRFHAVEADTVSSSYPLANPTSVRVAGREHRVRLTSASASDWRVGSMRLDVRTTGGRR